MHVIILIVILSPVDSCVTDNFQLKPLGRFKSINIFHWKFQMVEEKKTIPEGWGLTILEFRRAWGVEHFEISKGKGV